MEKSKARVLWCVELTFYPSVQLTGERKEAIYICVYIYYKKTRLFEEICALSLLSSSKIVELQVGFWCSNQELETFPIWGFDPYQKRVKLDVGNLEKRGIDGVWGSLFGFD